MRSAFKESTVDGYHQKTLERGEAARLQIDSGSFKRESTGRGSGLLFVCVCLFVLCCVFVVLVCGLFVFVL